MKNSYTYSQFQIHNFKCLQIQEIMYYVTEENTTSLVNTSESGFHKVELNMLLR